MRNVYSVGQVNAYIKNMFTQDFMLARIYVKGEVSNCKYHGSGHIYFSLKDSTGTIACVMFAGSRKGLAFRLADGQRLQPAELSPGPDGPCSARVVLRQGVYHQIKRMFGVYGAGVNELRRTAIGGLALDAALGPGGFRELSPAEVARILGG